MTEGCFCYQAEWCFHKHVSHGSWAAWYGTWLLSKLMPKGVFFSFLSVISVHTGQTREHIKVNLAEWISRSQAVAPSQAMQMPQGACMAVDFSLEKLSGFGDLLQRCTGLVRLEATGNDLTSLAGRPHHASAEMQPCAACFIWPCLSCPILSGSADH